MLFYTHEDCLAHEMQPGHMERPDRLAAVLAHLDDTGLIRHMDARVAPAAELSTLQAAHRSDYLAALEAISPSEGLAVVDPDTSLCPKSLDAASRAAGAVNAAVDEVVEGNATRAF